ncbi:MAG TPA: hypothetical protein VIL88_13965 [Devosia sp.]|jgi:hypothetical protein|uniref:hypothetical protein n=1 Tax=Devosia sp. TaxID=1871048 RepID=UPI002F9332AB
MKLKSLILGSVAAAGLSTAGFAADLGVLTSLDVCDELGLSGLTISSDTNCLQISGEVKYEFNWGNFSDGATPVATPLGGLIGSVNIDRASSIPGTSNNDWESRVQSWLKFVGTSGSDFGPASAVIKIKHDDRRRVRNGGTAVGGFPGVEQRETGNVVVIDEAYVQVGDTTVLTAGKRGSIFNKGDDEPFNFTGLFISQRADVGTVVDENDFDRFAPKFGNHVIQLWTNVGEGFIAKIGLENLGSEGGFAASVPLGLPAVTGAEKAGTLVGVLDYAGSGVTAHISGAVGGLLDGQRNAGDTYLIHTGVTATFDQFKVRAAGSLGGFSDAAGTTYATYWNALVSGEANFDMFKIALSAEAAAVNGLAAVDSNTDFGFGGSVGAKVAEGIELNLGGRYFNDGTAGVGDSYQVALQLIAAVTETLKITGEIGVYGNDVDTAAAAPGAALRAAGSDFYAKAELGWAPGGGFSSSLGATVQQNGAYKVTFKAAKSFQ